MKKLNNWLKNTFSSKKTINHTDPSKQSSSKMNLRESWSKLMHSTHKKLSEGASEFSRAIRSRGGSNSKISGRDANKGNHHHTDHKNNPPKK